MAKHLDLDGNVQGERNEYLGLHREKNCGCPNCYQPVSDDTTLPSLGMFNNDLVKAMLAMDVLSEDEVG
jgi:hypothetical protein